MTTEIDPHPPIEPEARTAAETEADAEDTRAGDACDEEICRLAAHVEEKLAGLAMTTATPVDVLRRRLLTRLSRSERRAAAERRSLRARKYVEQRGRCPLCGEQLELGRGRDVLPVEAHKPLACLACVRAQRGGAIA